ncbi:tripartite tricarboxylate transporter substrate binding protein [Shouchella lehensis]|uniref:Bordetella uptake gene product n=1 Tax=Shouchella lehensis G1 TaxID=1246626 RepID=A0A060LUA0_9BACI|nr:tripartite tricarboxylate transporter substrate binding protein [Shouchella lehensis]AIC93692.1 bordetella uptake gene product [Shouchella lehensis G1]
MFSKRVFVLPFLILFLSSCNPVTTGVESETYPSRSITGVIPFGPGGGADSIARVISQHTEPILGESIVLQNVEGGAGSIAAYDVHKDPANGYKILFGAENPNLYRTTGISDLSYHDYEPIMLFARTVPVVIVHPDSPFQTLDDLIEQAEADPGKILMATTGPVGTSGVVTSMLGLDFAMVPYKGEGASITGLMGKQIEASIVSLPSAYNYILANKVRVLGIVNDTRLEDFGDWPALGEVAPDYLEHLPWGAYYGAYVKKGTPEPIIEKLRDSFTQAFHTDEFQSFIERSKMISLGLTGDEALAYQTEWESRTNWFLYQSGFAEHPSNYNIPIPRNETQKERKNPFD